MWGTETPKKRTAAKKRCSSPFCLTVVLLFPDAKAVGEKFHQFVQIGDFQDASGDEGLGQRSFEVKDVSCVGGDGTIQIEFHGHVAEDGGKDGGDDPQSFTAEPDLFDELSIFLRVLIVFTYVSLLTVI